MSLLAKPKIDNVGAGQIYSTSAGERGGKYVGMSESTSGTRSVDKFRGPWSELSLQIS